MTTPRILVTAIVLLAAVAVARSAPSTPSDSPAPKKPIADKSLDAVQGTWERVVTRADGVKLGRVVKLTNGNKESVAYYDADDQLVRRHTATISVSRKQGIRYFTYSNLEVTDGADRGQKFPGPSSYVYKVQGDTFLEIYGLDDDDKPLQILVWKKVVTEPKSEPPV